MALPWRRYSRDGLAAALCIHLSIYCAAAACFGFGFYELMRPSFSPNPGLAAYKPPPGTVISYDLPARLKHNATPVMTEAGPETDARGTPAPAVEMTTRSTVQPPSPVPLASKPPAKQKKKPPRQVAAEAPKPQGSPCLPGYDSSGAQTRSC